MLNLCLAERKTLKLFPPDNIMKVIDPGSFDEGAVAELKKYYAAKQETRILKSLVTAAA